MKALRVVTLLLLACCFVLPLLRAQAAPVPATPASGEVIERLVAVVNREVILQSDWDEAVRYEALMAAKSLAELTPGDVTGALDRLIDQQLLRQQMQGFRLPAPSTAELEDKLAEVRKLYPEGSSDAGWRAALARYGISEKALNARLATQLEVMEFIDIRLRPEAKVTPQAVEDYYRQKLLPQLGEAADKASQPDAEVTAKIQELLTQEKIDELLTSWLRGLREQATIRVQAGPDALLGSAKSAANRAPSQPPVVTGNPQPAERDLPGVE
jgi:peptidyl-prolyl cis-trans isomerase SurA